VAASIMVQYRRTEMDARQKTLELIERTQEIHECYSITGEYDFMVRVYCKSMKEFNKLVNETLQARFIAGIHSYMLLACFKDQPSLLD